MEGTLSITKDGDCTPPKVMVQGEFLDGGSYTIYAREFALVKHWAFGYPGVWISWGDKLSQSNVAFVLPW